MVVVKTEPMSPAAPPCVAAAVDVSSVANQQGVLAADDVSSVANHDMDTEQLKTSTPAKTDVSVDVTQAIADASKGLALDRKKESSNLKSRFHYLLAHYGQEKPHLKRKWDELDNLPKRGSDKNKKKRTFMEEVVAAGKELSSPELEAYREASTTKAFKDEEKWISWQLLQEKEGREQAMEMVRLKSVVHRVHPKLKDSKLTFPKNSQFMYVEESFAKTSTTTDRLIETRRGDGDDDASLMLDKAMMAMDGGLGSAGSAPSAPEVSDEAIMKKKVEQTIELGRKQHQGFDKSMRDFQVLITQASSCELMSQKLLDNYKMEFNKALTLDKKIMEDDMDFRTKGTTPDLAVLGRRIKAMEQSVAYLNKYRKPIKDLMELETKK